MRIQGRGIALPNQNGVNSGHDEKFQHQNERELQKKAALPLPKNTSGPHLRDSEAGAVFNSRCTNTEIALSSDALHAIVDYLPLGVSPFLKLV